MKPRIVHIAVPFLRPTETFIYDRIAHHQRYEAYVLTDEARINKDLFPFDNVLSAVELPMIQGVANKLARRITGRLPFFEKHIRRLRPAAIHAHYGPVGVAALPLRRACGIPLITSFYGIDASAFLNDPNHRAGYRKLWRESEMISVLSEHMKQAIVNAGCSESKIRIHHLAVDTDALCPSSDPSSTPPPVRVMCASRLVEKKGVDTLLRAVAIARGRGVDVVCGIAGDGPLSQELRIEAKKLKIDTAVTFHGLLKRDETLDLMRRAHVFALLSRTAAGGDAEGTPTALIEAGALGLPCISTRHAGIPEVVSDEKTGLLVDENGHADAADALVRLAEDSDLRARLGVAAREKIQNEFSISKVITSIESGYDALSNTRFRA